MGALLAALAIAGTALLSAARDGAAPGGGVGAPPPAPAPPSAARGPGAPSPEPRAPATPAARLPAAPPPAAGPAAEEVREMERLRALVASDPAAARALAADLDRRFPAGPHVEERASLVIDALVRQGEIGQARAGTRRYQARYPDGRFGAHLEALTGVHPRPSEPGDQGGAVRE
jgi:hypothetical protein